MDDGAKREKEDGSGATLSDSSIEDALTLGGGGGGSSMREVFLFRPNGCH